MRKFLLLLIIALNFVVNNTTAQKCGSSLNMPLIQKENPELYNRLLQIENHTNAFINNTQLKSATVSNIIRIPVVVHVLWNTSSQNISDDQVQSQIEVLNEDFRRLNADKSNTPSAFSSAASDPEIEFFLACIDPNGNTTNGITRTQTNLTSFSIKTNADGTINETTTRIKFTSLGGRDAWPSNRYLNIWTCNLSSTLLGYAQFPGIGQANTDGVVIKYNCFGKRGTLDPTFNKGRTSTHEIGHWLNLRHIWGDDDNKDGTCTSNECSGSDFVADTPNQGESSSGTPTFPKLDCCTNVTPGVMFMNFMDYTDDAGLNLFTTGQTNRMRALFATGGFRQCFVSNPVIDNWCQSLIFYSGSSVVCSSGTTFTVNNATGYTVSWTCSTNISFDHQTGNNKTFTAAGTGTGTIQAILISGCGNITLPAKTVWVGLPVITSISGPSSVSVNQPASFTTQLSLDSYPDSYYWTTSPSSGVTMYPDGRYASMSFANSGTYQVVARAHNSCGWSDYFVTYIDVLDGFSLAISPNPTTTEAIIELVSTSTEKATKETEWNLEVYDAMQSMKAKVEKIKSNKQTLSTSGWKEGVYVVRAIIGKDIITGKLVVKP
ncbi:MAG: M43 family zinc metalloprotease [Prolixibacteraceae bacterium]|nr:M43 family zinc metalloprotease [Prolixibacteraceae bacterium]